MPSRARSPAARGRLGGQRCRHAGHDALAARAPRDQPGARSLVRPRPSVGTTTVAGTRRGSKPMHRATVSELTAAWETRAAAATTTRARDDTRALPSKRPLGRPSVSAIRSLYQRCVCMAPHQHRCVRACVRAGVDDHKHSRMRVARESPGRDGDPPWRRAAQRPRASATSAARWPHLPRRELRYLGFDLCAPTSVDRLFCTKTASIQQ